MTTLVEMVQNGTIRHHNKIKAFCRPLEDYFGVNCFTYNKVLNSGHFYSLGSHPGWIEHYYSEKLYLNQPHIRHPHNFRNGISLLKNIKCEKYIHNNQIAKEKFNVSPGLVILNHVPNGLEMIGLDTNTSNLMHDSLMINEINLIKCFIDKFITENKSLLNILEESAVNMEVLMGDKFKVADISIMGQMNNRKDFLKKMGVDIPETLTARENEVLTHLVEGKSATQIAIALHLSSRTIEHHLEKLKNKLNCHSKTELIKKARKIELFSLI